MRPTRNHPISGLSMCARSAPSRSSRVVAPDRSSSRSFVVVVAASFLVVVARAFCQVTNDLLVLLCTRVFQCCHHCYSVNRIRSPFHCCRCRQTARRCCHSALSLGHFRLPISVTSRYCLRSSSAGCVSSQLLLLLSLISFSIRYCPSLHLSLHATAATPMMLQCSPD